VSIAAICDVAINLRFSEFDATIANGVFCRLIEPYGCDPVEMSGSVQSALAGTVSND